MANSPDLKGSSFTLSVLHLSDNPLSETFAYLDEKVSKAPSFFASAPVVINISAVTEAIDFVKLKEGILGAGMVPVGVTGCQDKPTEEEAKSAGFAVMSGSAKPKAEKKQAPVAPAEPPAAAPTKFVHTPVRSGQQIYAQNSDLVILNHVSAGAEVIADGSIDVYGTLRGRAIAGASGQKDTRIICHDLQAELVSIAGNYWLSDQISSEFWKQQVMLSMPHDTLHFEVLKV